MILKRLEIITGKGITYGDKLNRVGKELLGDKFLGVFTETDMPLVIPRGQGALINKPANVHWIAQYADPKGKIHTFDSYGRKEMGPNLDSVPQDFKQKKNEKDCGSRSLAYLFNKLA